MQPDHEHGQVSASAAEVYDEFFVPALFGRFAAVVADAVGLRAAESVVDVACGTGALTRELRSRTSGRVVGVDLNPGMLDVARRNDAEVEYLEGDAASLSFGDGEFDVVVSQFGLMLFEDPVAALREFRRVGRRGTVAIWDSIDRSEGYSALQALFAERLGADAAASLDPPFAMGAPGVLEATLAEAGLGDASMVSISGSARFADVREWVTTEVRGWTLGESISDADLESLIEAAEVGLGQFVSADGCVVPMAARAASWG